MAEKPKSGRSYGPMIAFFAVVAGVVVALWWMSRPASPSGAQTAASSPVPVLSAKAGPGAAPSTDRTLCSVDSIKRYIASQLAAGEVPDSDLQQVSAQIMSELVQAGVAQNGCVSPSDVTAVLFDMAEDDQGEGF